MAILNERRHNVFVFVGDSIKRLERYIARYEARYEMSSSAALNAVRHSEMKETADIALWLSAYRDLQNLNAGNGHGAATGSSTQNT
jgi:hypothetical protein